MSQTATRVPQVPTWNMSTPLRVLVIEYTMADAELNLHELQQAGFQCRPHVVGTQEEFLDHLRRFHYDIVLADYRLPGWTGMDALLQVRRQGRDIPFILVTGELGEEIAVECIRQGVTDYVLKGHLARLPAVVSRALEEKTLRDARRFMVEALRQSESNSLLLFAHNPLPMWVFEKESLQFQQVNEAAVHHYGYERIEFLQMNVSDIHPPEEIPRLLKMFHDGSHNEKTPGQWHHRRKDGSLIDVEIFMHSMEYSGRASALMVAQDITERKRGEAERQKFLALVENSQDFIAVSDLDCNVQYINPSGRALLGMGESDSVHGTHAQDYVIAEDILLVRETIFPAILSSGHWEGELRFRHKQTGQALPMDYVGFLLKDPQSGDPILAAAISRDMTERKRVEEERLKFFTLVENSGDFIAVADLNDNIEYVNPAGRALLGMGGADSVQGTHSQDYVVAEDLALVKDTIFPAIYSAGHWKGELRFRHYRTGQTIPMDCVAFQVKDLQTGEARYIATVSRDITARRSLEQQLRQAQKFEAIGQLAGGIAHDFNNVIGAILGWAELGEEQAGSSDAPYAAYFKKIHSQCDRVTALVHQLLAFARRQFLEPRNLSLNHSVQDVLSLLGGVIGKDIELQTILAEDLAVVRVDPTQIEQVLMNLCINSRDAMPKGGRLTIKTRNADFSEVECRHNAALQPGRFAALSVNDTGVGMDAAVRERIFEPFFTTKGTGKGTGLGLATVYGIVKQHGGFILVESEPNRGSTFQVFLPISENVTPAENQPSVVQDLPVRGGTETLLIAEDHEGVREMACATLESLGYQILIAHDGEEAVEMFSTHRDSIALVLLDVIMPRRNGPKTYEAIQAMKPGTPVVFATGYSNETAALNEMVQRGVAVLRKPYSPGVLCRRIREALDLAAARSSKPA
jgi:PAS domain S-box-containing protein